MNEQLKNYIAQWLSKADEDLQVVEKLTTETNITSAACFHCQQAVEKYLKVFLIAHEKHVIKTHNIEFLLSECGDIDSEFNEIDPKNLSDFGVEIRYPSDTYIPSMQETIEYKNIATMIKKLVKQKIEKIIG